MATPVALTVAGSDSGGGAGIQADLKTFAALGVFGASAVTLVTAQNTRGLRGIAAVDPAMVAAQIAAVLEDMPPAAVKTGALGTAAVIEAVAGALAGLAAPIVLDPVMIATAGDPLLAPEAVATLRARLLPMAALVTPNLPEAARLTGTAEAPDAAAARGQAEAMLAAGARAVLVKGGHATGPECTDWLYRPDAPPRPFRAPRIATRSTHGTGCTLSAAIAALLARGLALEDAVGEARCWLQGALAAADALGIGHGRGPLHHFHALWPHGG